MNSIMIILSCCMSSTVTESRLSDVNSSRAMVWQRPALFSFGSFGRTQGHGRCRFCCARPRCIVPSRTNPWSHMRMAWQSFQAGCSHFGASKMYWRQILRILQLCNSWRSPPFIRKSTLRSCYDPIKHIYFQRYIYEVGNDMETIDFHWTYQ